MGKIKIDYDKGYLTEREVLLLKGRLNNHGLDFHDIPIPEEGFKLTPEQIEKGRAWLVNKWKTPRGKERKKNPFGYREMNVLENFKDIVLLEFVDRANYAQHQMGLKCYVPYYGVRGTDGSGFDYLVWAGVCEILG